MRNGIVNKVQTIKPKLRNNYALYWDGGCVAEGTFEEMIAKVADYRREHGESYKVFIVNRYEYIFTNKFYKFLKWYFEIRKI